MFLVYSKVIQALYICMIYILFSIYIFLVYIYIHTVFRFFALIGYYKILNLILVLYSRPLSVFCFIYGNVYMLRTSSQVAQW